MHTYVYCPTIYNSKDLKLTQMPINDRLDKENVAHIHHELLCSHKKERDHVLCRDMDEAGSHHSQQANTETQNQTPHVPLSISVSFHCLTPLMSENIQCFVFCSCVSFLRMMVSSFIRVPA